MRLFVCVHFWCYFYLFITDFVPLLQSRPLNLLFPWTAAATLLVRSSLLSVMMSLDTLCWAVKAQGQGQSLLRFAKCEHSLRSKGIEPLSIRKSAKKLMSFLISVSKRHQSSLTGRHKETPDRGQFKSWNAEIKLQKRDHYLTILLILVIMAPTSKIQTLLLMKWERDRARKKFGISS